MEKTLHARNGKASPFQRHPFAWRKRWKIWRQDWEQPYWRIAGKTRIQGLKRLCGKQQVSLKLEEEQQKELQAADKEKLQVNVAASAAVWWRSIR